MYRKSDINVLVACEESQNVTKAFRELGFNAFSCDIEKPRGHHPEWHICADVTPYLKGRPKFITCAGKKQNVGRWHLIIAHPPCTYLCRASAVHMVIDGQIQMERYHKMMYARDFFFRCYNAYAPFKAIENPIPLAMACLPPPSTFIDPSDYGHKYTKKTYLWLKNLPPLMASVIHPSPKCFVRCSRGKYRSVTFPGIAKAMAEQWGDFIFNELNKI